MTNKEAITILKNEVKCIQLQDTPKCARFVGGTCAVCPLVLPTATVLEAYRLAMDALSEPKGQWYYNYLYGWHCSICNKSVKDMPTDNHKAVFNFCPNCGADMRKEGEP